MTERDRQHAILPFDRLHPLDEAAHRFASGTPQADHAAVVDRGHRTHAAERRVARDAIHLASALDHVGVRVFLVADDHVRGPLHPLGEVAVEVELHADRDVGSDPFAQPFEDVAFAVVVPVGDHRTVQVHQHDVDRHRGREVVEQLVAKRLVHVARRASERLRRHADALGDVVPVRIGEAAELGEDAARAFGIGLGCATAAADVGGPPGRERHERVGLGGDRRDEELQGTRWIREMVEAVRRSMRRDEPKDDRRQPPDANGSSTRGQ